MIDYTKLTDSELITKCLERDAAAWETVVRRYQRLIVSVAMRCGLNSEDALDVFQSVSMALLGKLHTLRDQEKLGAWLVTLARHEAWRVKKKMGRTDLLEDEEWARIAESTEGNLPIPDQDFYTLERQQMVRRAEEQLSRQCRRLLTLLFYESESLSYVEIGRELEIPVSSIGPTRARCLAKMKEILLKLGFF
jgi:RNA polymerase sigma factor (sigma-70 family)